MKKRLAVILSHPVQYYAPLFRLLNERKAIDLKVFYTWGQAGIGENYDKGFGRHVEWDIPLLEGYAYELLENVSKHPGALHFSGIVNPCIIETIEKYQPDAILVFGWAFKSHLKVIRYFSNKVPVLFRGDSTLLDEQGGIKALARYVFLQWVYRHVDKALYVGKNNYEYYIKFGMEPSQLIWAPHAIDNRRFINDEYAHHDRMNKYKQELGIKENDFVFLFAGKFEPKKDPVLLLKAFLASSFDAAVHLVFTGNGVLESKLKLLAQGSKNIHFLDFQNQLAMPAIYRMAHVFVLPSQGPGETWGLAINEAMACRKPVIVSDKCGCAPDLVENAINGFVFKAGDMDQLRQKMSVLYHQRHKLPDMQEASLKKIQDYSYEKLCATLESLISEI